MVVSDVRLIAEDAAQIIAESRHGAEVTLCATLAEALATVRDGAAPRAVLVIEPRRPLDAHPLAAATAARGAWLVTMSEDAEDAPRNDHILPVRLPFTQQTLGDLVSTVVRDRPQG